MFLLDHFELSADMICIVVPFKDQLVTVKIIIQFGNHIDLLFFNIEKRNVCDQHTAFAPDITRNFIIITADVENIVRIDHFVMVVFEVDLFQLNIVKKSQKIFDPVKRFVNRVKTGFFLYFRYHDALCRQGQLFIEFDV